MAVVLIGLLVPAAVLAHGGVRQTAGDAVVTNFQEPLAPLVGERVTATYVFTDRTYRRLPDMPVTLTLIDTFPGDESRDQDLLTREYRTDANGQIQFEYTFAKENYFDVDLAFTDAAGQPQSVGFLIQPRDAATQPAGIIPALAAATAAGLAVGYLISRSSRRSRSSRSSRTSRRSPKLG